VAEGRSGWSAGAVVYWMIALFLAVFGLLAFLHIGAPFLLAGVTMIVARPFRRRPLIFWPVVVGVAGLCTVVLLVGPFDCERTTTHPGQAETQEVEEADCSSLLGIGYSGTGDYEPSFVPAILAGVGVGVVAAAAARLVAARGSAARP
jgi:hypothetical protein